MQLKVKLNNIIIFIRFDSRVLFVVCYSGFDFNSTFGEMKFREEETVLEIWNWGNFSLFFAVCFFNSGNVLCGVIISWQALNLVTLSV